MHDVNNEEVVMRAVLLSGGEGTRVRPFTLTTPKPFLSIANLPLIYYQFLLLKKYNFSEVIVGVGYKADYFRRAVGPAARKAGIKAVISSENTPLGTGGGLKNAGRFFGKKDKEPFIVFNGDVITDLNLERILAVHREKEAYATIGIVRVNDPSPYGLVVMDGESGIKKFIEKPKKDEIITDTINAGIYVFSPGVFGDIPPGRPVSLEKEVIPSMLEKGMSMRGYVHYGYWIDVGNVDLYRRANFDAVDGKTGLVHEVSEMNEGKLLAGRKTVLKEGVRIKGKVIIGDNCFVGRDCFLEDSIILGNTIIRDRCVISGSTIGADVLVENDCVISCAAIADKSLVRPFTRISGR